MKLKLAYLVDEN